MIRSGSECGDRAREPGSTEILGVRVDMVTTADVLDRVAGWVDRDERRTIMYANVHVVNLAHRDPAFRRILNGADIVYPDGHGVVLGSRMLGRSLPPRMTGADWIYDLCSFAGEKDISLYIVAGEPGIAEKARERLVAVYPRLRILGTFDGFFHARDETEKLLDDINEKRPDVLLVGMGSPVQEEFIDRVRTRMAVPVCWVVGALFDYVAGTVKRGPSWMLDHGLEWLYRLVYEPERMWRRYLIGNSLFLARILRERIRGGA